MNRKQKDKLIGELHNTIVDGLSDLVDEQAAKFGVDADELFQAVAADIQFRAATAALAKNVSRR
jgi:ribosomal protein L7/L12